MIFKYNLTNNMFIYAFAQYDAIIFICTEQMGYRFISFSTNGPSSSLAKVPMREEGSGSDIWLAKMMDQRVKPP